MGRSVRGGVARWIGAADGVGVAERTGPSVDAAGGVDPGAPPDSWLVVLPVERWTGAATGAVPAAVGGDVCAGDGEEDGADAALASVAGRATRWIGAAVALDTCAASGRTGNGRSDTGCDGAVDCVGCDGDVDRGGVTEGVTGAGTGAGTGSESAAAGSEAATEAAARAGAAEAAGVTPATGLGAGAAAGSTRR
ncbi:hypothetical protein [Streptacidiphilus fuscans]|uniref:Uncharacterized protein n=1 Tax=Streptacidiphilus fuscans TaxID=2789292 RepID=A0A931B409_9ACTN|nr:hypothetical protein [Streptacidiphilus fuscans]MBF9069836.1 hypothetical protein [Streptacidiphilus fuscans]